MASGGTTSAGSEIRSRVGSIRTTPALVFSCCRSRRFSTAWPVWLWIVEPLVETGNRALRADFDGWGVTYDFGLHFTRELGNRFDHWGCICGLLRQCRAAGWDDGALSAHVRPLMFDQRFHPGQNPAQGRPRGAGRESLRRQLGHGGTGGTQACHPVVTHLHRDGEFLD